MLQAASYSLSVKQSRTQAAMNDITMRFTKSNFKPLNPSATARRVAKVNPPRCCPGHIQPLVVPFLSVATLVGNLKYFQTISLSAAVLTTKYYPGLQKMQTRRGDRTRFNNKEMQQEVLKVNQDVP
jgi:hypothetical protein